MKLLMLSGGIDSAYCLHKHFEEGDTPIRLHHVHLYDWEGRASMERQAVNRILYHFRKKKSLIHYTESTVNFGTLGFIPYNYHLWAYWAGAIFASDRNITQLVIPRHSDAFENEAGAEGSNRAYITTINNMSGREPELLFPMVHLTKAEVIEDCPSEILRAAWYCRRPKGGRTCNKCKTCKQVQTALKKKLNRT
jgi:7-cyano-7-deazaguanine synthase in queuosine biosynthesis